MRLPLRWSALIPAVGIALVACSDQSPVAPEDSAGPSPRFAIASASTEVCNTITFDGYTHGADINTVAVPGFGFSLTLDVDRYNADGTTSDGQGMAYSTNNVSASANEGTDLEHTGPHARCPSCSGLNSILVIERPNTSSILDYNGGGTLTFSGFPDGYYLKSYTVIDNDTYEAGGVQYVLGGSTIATSSPLGDGSVQTVVPATQPIISGSMQFRIGTLNPYDAQSGGIDNLVICRRVTTGGCTRTIGYWKTHDGGGPQDDMVSRHLPITLGDDVVDNTTESDMILAMSGPNSNGLIKLRAQLLAAMLNVSAGADGSAISATITAANAFLDANNVTAGNINAVWSGLTSAQRAQVNAWKDQLDGYNNGLIGPGHCNS